MQASDGVQVTVTELVEVPGTQDLAMAEIHHILLSSVCSVADPRLKMRVQYQMMRTDEEDPPYATQLTSEVIIITSGIKVVLICNQTKHSST